ncbi:MAG: hypothetical protein UV54_C0013G0015 [Candidatus Beckwithbacteria bacterium GW2011_GWA2_43_10]|uniref:Transketolase-like pyrimidine-binding domain-containing protein n=1 Tax=Candidatus Beckwithbacteria bacterium GW2011_GWA2_43_10 TaxID=1618369 RepID=A0A0G1C3H7_9BACT|nr:MAG: hypothetical protein UV54_C0013G0015 [Candidatus Beckwithbacteria bacterium GW2011_GWA2_43_10]
MRQQLVKTVSDLLKKDKRLILLLGDIGVYGFQQAFKDFPDRVYNIGIFEQATVSLAAGLAKTGLIPVFYSIAPFIAERALEQLKIDFGYQQLRGNFVSVGGSYDYAALGATHQCPADVNILKQIPGMKIIVPGTAEEFDRLFREVYSLPGPHYFRLSESVNKVSFPVKFGCLKVIRKGKKAAVLAVGPMLDKVLEASRGLDVSVIYCTTVAPMDKYNQNNKLLICEPYYSGALTAEILKACYPRPMIIDQLGVPNKFLKHYGRREEQDKQLGLTVAAINQRLRRLIND